MKKTRKILSILLTLSLLCAFPAAVFASTFTDAHGNVIELDDTLEAYTSVDLLGADDSARKGETNLGDLWTDALLWFAASGRINEYFEEDDVTAGNDKIAVEADHIVALWNGGNLRDDLKSGKFGAEDLAKVLPYPNKVAVVYMTGAQLTEALEAASQCLPYSEDTAAGCASFMQAAGLSYSLDLSKAFDKGEEYKAPWYRAASVGRVTIDDVNGNDLVPEDTYAVITSNANFNGMDSSYVFKEAAAANGKSTITTAVVRDVVWMYLSQAMQNVVGENYAEPQGRIVLENVPLYTDVSPEAWYYNAAAFAAENGLMEGDGGKFYPAKTATRAQFITVMYRMAGSPEVGTEGSEWWAPARAWAMAEGISDGERMSSTISRQEAVTMLYRWIQKQGKGFEGLWAFELEFPDAGDVADWADEAMHWMVMNHIIEGSNGQLLPKGTMTRAQMAQILMGFCNLPE